MNHPDRITLAGCLLAVIAFTLLALLGWLPGAAT
jgi:hypothetical protein